MPVVQVEAQLPTDELLRAVGQLNQADLEQFVSQVIALRAKRQAPSLPRAESELLLKINEGGVPLWITWHWRVRVVTTISTPNLQ
jgi:hypothetical protein